MKNFVRVTLIASVFATVSLCACSRQVEKVDNTPVKELRLSDFLGKWYEIARYDHKFERGLDNVTAEYTLKDDGMVKVVNSGWKDGEQSIAEGKAKQPDPSGNPANLKVSFFLFFYADYNILMLDSGYSYALIGSKSDKYLWILSRTPVLSAETKDAILSEASRRGYDTASLIWVDQSRNIAEE